MLPKTHLLLGTIFSVLIYFLFDLTLFQASLVLLASVFIDVDHYLFIIKRKNIWNLKKAYYWHKGLPKNHKTIMHVFHTLEFMILILIMSYFWNGFLFIFIGIFFHSILDILDLFCNYRFGVREFSLIRYIIRSKDKYF
jgi:hypothetical protein